MTQLEILELAVLGTAHKQSAASKEYVKTVINAVPGSSSSEASKEYYLSVCRDIDRERAEIFRLIAKEKERSTDHDQK